MYGETSGARPPVTLPTPGTCAKPLAPYAFEPLISMRATLHLASHFNMVTCAVMHFLCIWLKLSTYCPISG